jgi:tetratricopeptide (TPR) repeat protein
MSPTKLPAGILILGILLYAALIVPFSDYMKQKPVEEKLGYIPNLQVVRVLSVGQKELAAASLLMKVIMYFGGVVGKQAENVVTPPLNYQEMERVMLIALKLDPYNMDGYYFAQSVLVWDMKQYQAANDLLEYGMKYRTWDWYLPFSAGFNYAYFLKDYKKAATMYMRAGDISGDPMFSRLAGKYLQQSGQTEAAIAYLEIMAKEARDKVVRNVFMIRIKALKEVARIEKARDSYKADVKRLPSGIDTLVSGGYLKKRPVDPYGGVFFLKPDGTVASTSNFVFSSPKSERK